MDAYQYVSAGIIRDQSEREEGVKQRDAVYLSNPTIKS